MRTDADTVGSELRVCGGCWGLRIRAGSGSGLATLGAYRFWLGRLRLQ